MLHARGRTILAATSIAVACTASCGRIGFDLLPEGQRVVLGEAGAGTGGETLDASSGGSATAGAGGTTSASGGAASGGTAPNTGGGTGQGGSSGSSGSGGVVTSSGGAIGGPDASKGDGGPSSGGASSGGASAGDGGPDAALPPVCANVSSSVKVWSFDATVEGWQFWPNAGTGTLGFSSTTGNPTNGALSLDVQSGNGTIGWLVFDAAAPNLTGQSGTAWVWVDAANVGLKLYSQSNPKTFAWADGGFVTLTPQTWTCLSLDFTRPVYSEASFDPTAVVRFGIEVSGMGPFKLYVDQLSY